MRYAFNAPTQWNLDLTIYMAGALYLIGGGYAYLLDAHVRVDILYERFSKILKRPGDYLTVLCIFIFAGTLAWTGALWMWRALVMDTTSGGTWSFPIWPVRLVIPVGASLLLLQAIAQGIRFAKVGRKEVKE